MKNTHLLIVAMLALLSCKTTQPTATKTAVYKSVAEKRSFFLDLAKQYGPDATRIIEAEENHARLVSYADHETAEGMIKDYGTVVHEACHSYNFHAAQWGYKGFYITGEVFIQAPYKEVFNANILNTVVPKELQTKIFRYNTYIGDGSKTSSQVSGIYGMLNEFSAYYHGSKAQLQLFEYYKKKCTPPTQDCWEDCFANMGSELYAYYEFRLFMAWYLVYAKANYPAVYQQFMENKALRLAYTLLNQQYGELVNAYFAKREEMIALFKAQGVEVRVDGEYLIFRTASGSSGQGTPDQDIAYLKGLMKPNEEAILAAFELKGANLQNYAEFLK
jgi:hypothetical protein